MRPPPGTAQLHGEAGHRVELVPDSGAHAIRVHRAPRLNGMNAAPASRNTSRGRSGRFRHASPRAPYEMAFSTRSRGTANSGQMTKSRKVVPSWTGAAAGRASAARKSSAGKKHIPARGCRNVTSLPVPSPASDRHHGQPLGVVAPDLFPPRRSSYLQLRCLIGSSRHPDP